MQTGKTIEELSAELTRRQALKKDLVADTRNLFLDTDGQTLETGEHVVATQTTPHAHGQIASWAGIPKRYYDRCLEVSPELLSLNVNHWLKNPKEPTRRMVRIMDGTFRAFLSDRYRRMDNEQVAHAALSAMMEMDQQNLRILSCDVTDSKLYIQAAFPRVEGEVVTGDPVQAGLIISNSEIGQGALDVRPIVYRLVCMNGMVVPKDIDTASMRRNHVGRRVEADEDYSIYRDETIEADDKALQLKIRDTIHALADQRKFDEVIEHMRAAASTDPVQNPAKAVETLSETFELPSAYQGGVLESLIRERDYSLWGMANAVTAQAHSAESYDDSVELEQLGGKLLSMQLNQWQRIAEAA